MCSKTVWQSQSKITEAIEVNSMTQLDLIPTLASGSWAPGAKGLWAPALRLVPGAGEDAEDQTRLSSIEWGFTREGYSAMLNARSETLNQVPSWAPVLGHRCVLPIVEFMERESRDDATGTPGGREHWFTTGETLWAAGMYRVFNESRSRQFVLLTMDANDSIRTAGNIKRMPVSIPTEDLGSYLDRSVTTPNAVQDLVRGFTSSSAAERIYTPKGGSGLPPTATVSTSEEPF